MSQKERLVAVEELNGLAVSVHAFAAAADNDHAMNNITTSSFNIALHAYAIHRVTPQYIKIG